MEQEKGFTGRLVRRAISQSKKVAMLALFAMTLVGVTHPVVADEAKAKALQQMDCEWWDYVTQFAYQDYALLNEAQYADPLSTLKRRMEYADYHAFSAGRAMLDAVIDGLNTQSPMLSARAEVAALCLSFPAIAVAPDFVQAPMLGDTL